MPQPPSEPIAAGAFGAWLAEARAALRGGGGTNVPCGDCVGCCISSYHIPLRPSDSLALARVPSAYLTRSPPNEHGPWLMGYDAAGRCPMFDGRGCGIYGSRPQTCRDYDCRIFAAAGIEAGDERKAVINARVRAWEFHYETPQERAMHAAIRAAADFIRRHADRFAPAVAPTSPTGIAVLAIKAYGVFLRADLDALTPEMVARALIEAGRQFDRG